MSPDAASPQSASPHRASPLIARRAALTAGLVGLGAVAVAACSSTASPGSGAAGGQGSPPRARAGTRLTKLDDIKVGGSVSARLDGDAVVISRPTATTAACFSAICTHQGCTVNPEGDKFVCPCHGSVYDATTGKVLHGPAPRPLPQIRVTVTNGEVTAK